MKLLWRSGSFETNPIMVDVLRGIAAALVVLAHADANYMIRIDLVMAYKSYLGEIGVYLFFILSGYLIWNSARRTLPFENGLKAYAIHRLTRVVPLYYVNIAFVLAVSPFVHWSFEADHSAFIVIRHLFFTQDLVPSVSRAINPVLWTLTHEAVFYLLVPVLFLARRRILLIALTVLVFSVFAWQTSVPIIGNFVRIFPLFMFGVLMAEREVMATLPPSILAAGLAIAAGALGAIHPAISALWAIAIFAVGGTLLPSSAKLWVPVRAFAWVGTVSYSLYIWHYLMLEIIGPWWVKVPWIMGSQTLHSILFVGACLLVSSVSYFAVEKPSMETLRRWMIGRDRQSSPRHADSALR